MPPNPRPAKPPRLIGAGVVLLAMTMAFGLVMFSTAQRSNDPVALMRLVGGICGGLTGLAATLVVIGLARRRSARV